MLNVVKTGPATEVKYTDRRTDITIVYALFSGTFFEDRLKGQNRDKKE
jgi:hypothetical protein